MFQPANRPIIAGSSGKNKMSLRYRTGALCTSRNQFFNNFKYKALFGPYVWIWAVIFVPSSLIQ